MSLVTQEFDLSEVVTDDYGEIGSFTGNSVLTFVAIYDPKKYNPKKLRKTIDEFCEADADLNVYKPDKDVVIMLANEFKKLRKMIEVNYTVIPKEK